MRQRAIIPVTRHMALSTNGGILAAGPAERTLTSENLAIVYDIEARLEH